MWTYGVFGACSASVSSTQAALWALIGQVTRTYLGDFSLTCQPLVFAPTLSCALQCGGGTQTREAHCIQGGVEVAAATCTATVGAALTSQACNTGLCSKYQWQAGTFGSCSASCGGGTQTVTNTNTNTNEDTMSTSEQELFLTFFACVVVWVVAFSQRSVQCFDTVSDPTFSNPLTNGLCVLSAPASLQACNTASCGSANPSFKWYTSNWGRCSASCRTNQTGTGLTTRTVKCVNVQG